MCIGINRKRHEALFYCSVVKFTDQYMAKDPVNISFANAGCETFAAIGLTCSNYLLSLGELNFFFYAYGCGKHIRKYTQSNK